MLRASVALAVLVFGIFASVSWAQAPVTPNVGPPGPPPNGEQLYMENCVECHGPEGDVVPDVDLGHGRFRRATTDPELIGIVLRGIPNTAMPPNNFSEAQASAIVQYLRAKARRAAASAGNTASGQRDFYRQRQLHELSSRQRQRLAAWTGSQRDWPPATLDRHRERHPRSRRPHRAEQSFRAARDARRRHDHRAPAESGRLHRAAPRFERAAAHADACRPQGIRVHRQIANAVVPWKAESAGDYRSCQLSRLAAGGWAMRVPGSGFRFQFQFRF